MSDEETTEASGPRSQMFKHEAMVTWINEKEGVDLDTLSAAEIIAYAFARRVEWRKSDTYRNVVDNYVNTAEERKAEAAKEREAAKAAKAEERAAAKAAKDAEKAAAKAAKEEAAEAAKAKPEAEKATKATKATKTPAKATKATKATKKAASADGDSPFE